MEKTITYREDSKGWVSLKSFIPEHGMSVSNNYFTFKDGEIYQHHIEGTNANDFYSPQTVTLSHIDVLLNDSPDIIKRYNTINYEGTQSRVLGHAKNYYDVNFKTGWFVESIVTDEGRDNEQHGTVPEFIEKEGKWFNYIKGEQSTWDALDDYNLDSSEFSFQGLGNTIAQPTTTLPVIIAVLFGITDSADDDTLASPGGVFPYTNPISSGMSASFLSYLASSNQPYHFENPYNLITFGSFTNISPTAFTSTSNITAVNEGYESRSNMNEITSNDTVTGYQTITLECGSIPQDPGNPFSAISACNLRINGHTLSEHVTDDYVNFMLPQSKYSDHATAPMTCHQEYFVAHPDFNTLGTPLVTYTLGASNTDVIIKYIEILEDYTVEYDHLASSGLNTHPGHIHIKVYFEDFVMPAENIVIPIDIDHTFTVGSNIHNLTVSMELGTSTPAGVDWGSGNTSIDQYYQSRTSENLTIAFANPNTGMTTWTFTKVAGTQVTDTIMFAVVPVDTYTIGNNASEQENSAGVVDGNVWGEACDNLTNQSLMVFGGHTEYPQAQIGTYSPDSSIYASWTADASNPTLFPPMNNTYWLSGGAPNNTTNGLGNSNVWISDIEVVEIDQTGANNYNVNSVYATSHSTSLDRIRSIKSTEAWDGYTAATAPVGSFPDWITVEVELDFTMPNSTVDIFVPVQHMIRRQISSLPATPWEFGCTDPLATNQTTFGSSNTPVNDVSCTFPLGTPYTVNIHYVNGQFKTLPGGTSGYSNRHLRMTLADAFYPLNNPPFTTGSLATTTHVCNSGANFATTYPNGIVKQLVRNVYGNYLWDTYHYPPISITTSQYTLTSQLPTGITEWVQRYPMGKPTDNPTVHTMRVFGSNGDVDPVGGGLQYSALKPHWYNNNTLNSNYQLTSACTAFGTTVPALAQYAAGNVSKNRKITMSSWGNSQGVMISTTQPTGSDPGTTYQDSIDKITEITLEEVYYLGWAANHPFPYGIRLTTKLDFVMPNSDVDIYISIDQDITDLENDPWNLNF